MKQTVTCSDFCRLVGAMPEALPKACIAMLETTNFVYDIIEGKEREEIILEVLKKIDNDRQIIGAKERDLVWEQGWRENLNDFVSSDHDLATLVPKFIRPGKPVRFDGHYIKPENPNFELDYYTLFRYWLFNTYMRDFNPVYEFGCGTGFNLVELAQLFPHKKYHGLDYAAASAKIVDEIAKSYGWNITGHGFDMESPDHGLAMEKTSMAFTNGAIEQLAGRFEAFIQFLLVKKPALCVHVEPVLELYDETVLFDYLAIKFHKKRGYTQGLLPRLEELEKNGKIKIEKVKRIYFGSLLMEGYSYIVWRPL